MSLCAIDDILFSKEIEKIYLMQFLSSYDLPLMGMSILIIFHGFGVKPRVVDHN
jgi:hypothetical protein